MPEPSAPTRNNAAAGARPDTRPQDDRFAAVSMDPAQQSLADALRITFRVIQLVMIVLVVLFVSSGFDTVSEGEQGIRLAFGRVKESNLPPGRQFHLPYPVGELIKVPTGQRSLRIDRAFFPELSEGQRVRSFESLAGTKRTLVPGVDGSLITGDGNIAHASWTVLYRSDDARSFVENLHRDDVDAIVRAVVSRGVVRTVAELDIEQFLKRFAEVDEEGAATFTGEGVVESRVRAIAQASLDQMNSGIRIDRVTLDDRIPPLFVYNEFQSVSTAQAQANRQYEEAIAYQREALIATAGTAHGQVLDLIEEYERSIELNGVDGSEDILARIDALLDGEPGEDDATVSGEVTRVINAARQYRTDVVASARGRAARFAAKLEQYRTNPSVFVTTEWSDAYLDFLDMARAEVFPLPPNSARLELILNSDPDIVRQLEAERNRREAEQTVDQRLEEVQRTRREQRRQQATESRQDR